jgi:hypothetical protein
LRWQPQPIQRRAFFRPAAMRVREPRTVRKP